MATATPERGGYGPAPGSVQVHRRRLAAEHLGQRPKRTTRRERIESAGVFFVFAALAFALGYHVLTVNKVVVFDGVSRLASAYMALWDAPPKLAAIGFTNPPVPALLMIPYAAIKPLASSLTSLPLFSAIGLGLTMMVLGRLLLKMGFALWARLLVLVLFAVDPMWAFYGSNGAPEIAYLFFLAVAFYCFISWYDGHETVYLIGAGLAMGVCILGRYGLIAMAVLFAFMIAAGLYRRGADRDEIEGSAIAYLAPIVYAFTLWTILNLEIIGSAFGWLSSSGSSLAINSDQVVTGAHYSLTSVADHMLHVIVAAGPVALVALPALVIAFVVRRDTLSLWLAGLVALTILLVGADAVGQHSVSRVVLANGLPVQLVAVMSLVWVYELAGGLRIGVLAALLAALALSLPLAWNGMLSYPFQDMEQAFVHALQRPGQNLTGTGSRGGYTVGLRSELAMAGEIKRLVGGREHSVLVDNSQSYAVILLTGRPDVFVDRSQHGDGAWKRVLNHPYGRVRYMLIASQSRGDLIRARYPLAASGGNPALAPVFTTARYVLVRVLGPVGGGASRPAQRSDSKRSGGARNGR